MPTQLGKYTLEKKIGAGGMADVWLARGPNGVCVLKCPHPHLCGNPDFVRMFLDEASLLAQLHHPGIAQIHDLGQDGGAYYLAMEYVPGFDLMSISLEHERHGELMAPELCARIVADAAAALHYAHEATGANGAPLNLVHRDVTPHNILLSRQGVVKLIDFGVAKASTTTHRTQAGFVKGKYPYMSPEQITGQVIDRRVDVYALGLVLYELLTNVRAIPGNTEVEQIDSARAGRIRPIEQLRPNVPVPLRQILGGCLHPEVEGRYPTALAVKVDLEKFLALERHVVGQEDLLRLFRVVAADTGEVSAEARPTEQDQPVSGAGVVVLPDHAAPGKVDELGYSQTAPSMKSLSAMVPEPAPAPAPSNVGPVPAPTLQLERATDVGAPPQGSRGALGVVAGLSVLVIGLVLALWQPWVEAPGVAGPEAAVDAGEIADAGTELVTEVLDAGAPTATPPDPRAAVVNVTSVIAADVLVDGTPFGPTPQKLELQPGQHTIVVRSLTGSVIKTVVWTLAPGETKALAVAAPAPARKGTLNVDALPFCSLIVNGKAQPGPALSLWKVELPAGRYTVQCRLEDPSLVKPRVKTQKVTITGGEDTSVQFDMRTE